MVNRFRLTAICLTALTAIVMGLFTPLAKAENPPPEQLNAAIEAKSKELQEIQKKLQETQQNLDETSAQGRTLSQELARIKKNIGQLDLGIRKNTVTISKLSLEIGTIEDAIREADEKISTKKDAIREVMRATQVAGDESPIIVFLKNETLAGAVDETSRLSELNVNLSDAIAELAQLNAERTAKLSEKTNKKKDVETQYKELAVKKIIVEDTKRERQEVLKETKNKESAYQQMITDLAKRQFEIASEIEEMDAQLRLKINPNALPREIRGILSWPVAGNNRRITQGYGGTAFALRGGYRGRWHNGVDIGGSLGASLIAAYEGTVIAVGNQDKHCPRGAYGKFVVIKHPNNLVTLYSHLSEFGTEVGARVNRGDTIGYMGKTGYALGVHLHFTVYDGTTFSMRGSRTCGPMPSGGDLDPQKYL